MKQSVITVVLMISSALSANAQTATNSKSQSVKYVAAMKENILLLDTANTSETFALLSNNFERIALAEQNDWLSYYYAANSTISQASKSADKDAIDMLADKGEAMLKKADSLSKNNSEIYCLYYLLSYVRIKADPMGRFQQYGTMASEYIGLAKQYNPGNPRAWLCEAQVVLHTPEAFGGGKNAAKPLIEETVKKFGSFKPETDISPNWGNKTAQQLWEQANK